MRLLSALGALFVNAGSFIERCGSKQRFAELYLAPASCRVVLVDHTVRRSQTMKTSKRLFHFVFAFPAIMFGLFGFGNERAEEAKTHSSSLTYAKYDFVYSPDFACGNSTDSRSVFQSGLLGTTEKSEFVKFAPGG